MKKTTFFCLFFFLFSQLAFAQWVESVGGTSTDFVNKINVDLNGNVYLLGEFYGTADFDPGEGTHELTYTGTSSDIFYAKYDNSGKFVWAKNIGAPYVSGGPRGNGIAIDGYGNVYLTGNFTFTCDFDPGDSVRNLTSAGSNDVFFAKYNSNGNYQWAKNVGGSYLANDFGIDIAVTGDGKVFVTGSFESTGDFNPDSGVYNLTSQGGKDVFFARYSSSGEFIWAKSVGGASDDIGTNITFDNNGNILIAGIFEGTADFESGAGVYNLTGAGGRDVFFVKYTMDGDFILAKNIGGLEDECVNGMFVDGSGNIYIDGEFQGTADFDPSENEFNLTSNGDKDFFFAKYNPSGQLIWAKSIGGDSDDIVNDIAVDKNGNVYLIGYFSLTVDFDPGAGVEELTTVGSSDVFFAKYNLNGEYVWAKNIGTPGISMYDFGEGLAIDRNGYLFITGDYQGTADFDPGEGETNLTSAGDYDVFFGKYTSSGTVPVEQEMQTTPSEFNLLQNYPNPFNPTTTIRYAIPASVISNSSEACCEKSHGISSSRWRDRNDIANVILKVYDALGCKVATLVNKAQAPGNYSLQFNAANLPSGIYFYTLRAGGFTTTKKMILMK